MPRTAPSQPESSLLTRYEELRAEGIRRLEAGHVEEAEENFEAALALAEQGGDRRLVQVAHCNLSAVRIERDEDETVPSLRRLLMEADDHEVCFLAAYNLARFHERREDFKKALFYSRLAVQRASLGERPDWLGSGHNQAGNLLIYGSRFQEAEREYRAALELMPESSAVKRALLHENLGYCRIVQGDLREGVRHVFRSLRTLRALGVRLWLVFPHMDLCYAYLELGRYRHARRHGSRALALAREVQNDDACKKCLYLLGEVAHVSGDSDLAEEHFTELQRRYYPEIAGLKEMLLALDLRKLVNLKA